MALVLIYASHFEPDLNEGKIDLMWQADINQLLKKNVKKTHKWWT